MLNYSNYLKVLIEDAINESFDVVETIFGNNHPHYNDGKFGKNKNFITTKFLFKHELIEVSFCTNSSSYYVKFKIGDFKEEEEEINFTIESKLDVRRNDALQIFNRVIFVIKKFVEKYQVEEITFEGARSNLQNLYSILVSNKRFLNKMKEIGFSYIENNDDLGIFTFRRN